VMEAEDFVRIAVKRALDKVTAVEVSVREKSAEA